MTYCSRDSNPPELLEQLGNSAHDWMLEGRCDVQKKLGGGTGICSVGVCVYGLTERSAGQ
jgi:hypothetical protein